MIKIRAGTSNHRSKFRALSAEEVMKSFIRYTLSSFLSTVWVTELSSTAGLLQSFISSKYICFSIPPYHLMVWPRPSVCLHVWPGTGAATGLARCNHSLTALLSPGLFYQANPPLAKYPCLTTHCSFSGLNLVVVDLHDHAVIARVGELHSHRGL